MAERPELAPRRVTAYIVIEESSALTACEHDRCRSGLNHLAFRAGTRDDVDRFVAEAEANG